MSVLLQTRMSSEFNKNVEIIEKVFPSGSKITYTKAKRKQETLAAVRYILNHYEFIAVGLRHRDLDEKLMRDCICSQLCGFCARADDVIRTVREEDAQGRASAEKKTYLADVAKLTAAMATPLGPPKAVGRLFRLMVAEQLRKLLGHTWIRVGCNSRL
jgi:hypothetical protein